MKKQLFIFILSLLAITTIAQNCSCITVKINKNNGTEIKSGITKSDDSYTLLIQKEINLEDLSMEPKYFLSLTMVSKIIPSEIIQNTKGKIELLLKDNSKIVLDKAKCLFDPVSSGFSVVYGAIVKKEQLDMISKNPIVSFNAFSIVKTSFREKKQKEQQKIIRCLLDEDL